MAGLLDFEDPRTMGLLNAGLGIMAQAGDTSRQFGLGQALASGLNTMQQTQLQAEMLKRQKAQEDLQMQMRQMQFGQMQQEVSKQKAMEDAMVNYAKFKQGGMQPTKQAAQVEAPSSVQSFSMPTAQSQNDRVNGSYAPQASLLKMPTQETPQAPAPKVFSKGDLVKSQISELMKEAEFYGSRPDYQSQVLAQQAQAKAIKLANEMPKFSNDYKVGYDKNGNLVNVRTADDGSEIYSPTKVAEKLHFGDNGQQLLGIDQYTGKSKVISQKQQTPDSAATNSRLWSEFNFKKQQDAAPTWNNEVGAFIAKPDKLNPQGKKIELAGYTKEEKPLTEVQAKAVTFASRMKNANDIVNELSGLGVDKSSAGKKFVEAVPFIGGGLGSIYNTTLPENIQKLDQAKRDWINANLRNESGAAIGKDEFYSADQQYFPQIGDKPEVIKQKAINRKLAEDGMRSQAGRGSMKIDSIVEGVKIPSNDGWQIKKVN